MIPRAIVTNQRPGITNEIHCSTTGMLSSGRLDHIPADIVERTAPALAAHRTRVLAHPGVRAYYARFGL